VEGERGEGRGEEEEEEDDHRWPCPGTFRRVFSTPFSFHPDDEEGELVQTVVVT
jgi:hypothetical protein